MQTVPSVILLEFNELCPTLLQGFIERGGLPSFQRLHDASQVFITDAGESPPNLEPWIQWVTVHSGMPYADHGIFHLGDGRNLKDKCVAELLSDAGVPVGVFGSMNTNYTRLNGYFIPDPWDKHGKPEPPLLDPYSKVVSKQVQEASSNQGLSLSDVAGFGWFLARHGLRPATAMAVTRQLISEHSSLR